MCQEIEEHIAAAHAAYKPIMTRSDGRLIGGQRLWEQFEQAVAAFRHYGRRQVAGVIERVNELTVAKQLLLDSSLGEAIEYEPAVVPNGNKFDFVAVDTKKQTLYIEVKTVEPTTGDNEQNWQRAERRREKLTPGTNYVVEKKWMGASVFGNSFSARSSFMAYTRETEAKLSAHDAIRPGRAILVFCGTGIRWDLSELEDFADFYVSGVHRADDPFANMELHAIKNNSSELIRNLCGFAAMMREHDQIDPAEWVYPVRGPKWD